MSIEKNNSGNTDNYRTIKVLSKLPLNGTSGTATNIVQNVTLTNGGYHLTYPSNHVFYNVMRCSFASGASGYLMGVLSSTASKSFYIKVESNTIKWYVGSTMVASRAREDGVHDIGFVGGYAIYDNKKVNTSQSAVSSTIHDRAMTVGGVTKTNGTHEYFSGLVLYRFNVTVYNASSPSSSSLKYLESFYPLSGQTKFVNARKYPDAQVTLGSGTASASTTAVTYGVQLDDLREITGSGYRDLLAIVADDGGPDTAAGVSSSQADSACVLSKTGETSRNCAVFLGNGSTHVVLPSGWSATKSGDYILGELIKGRTPKWSIWNDAIKFGKYADTSTQPSKVRFNVFKNNDGSNNGKISLELFKDYDTAANYPPYFDLADSLTMQFHNTVACTIDSDKRMTGQGLDEDMTFVYSQTAGGLSLVRLGNLPLWNYTKAELDAGTPALQEMRAVGGGLIFTENGDVAMVFFESTDEDNMPLCANSSTATKNKFKYNGFSGTAFFLESMTDYLRRVLLNNTEHQVDLQVDIALSLNKSQTPTNLNIVNCSRLVPTKTSHVVGSYNPRMSSSTPTASEQRAVGDRFIVGENGGFATVSGNNYQICIGQYNRNSNVNRISQEIGPGGTTTSRYGYGIATTFGLLNGSNEPVSLFDSSGNPLYVAFLVATAGATDNSGVASIVKERFIGFSKIFKNDASTSSSGYYTPFAYGNNWYTRNIYRPDASKTGLNDLEVAAAWFMWQDLLTPGQTRSSGGKAPTEPTSSTTFPKRFKYSSTVAPITAHFKVFKLSEAPHCWTVYCDSATYDAGHRHWDNTTGCPYIRSTYDYYFHYENNLMPYGSKDCVDAYVSIWNGNTWQSSASQIATALNGRTITMYHQIPFEPQESRATNSVAFAQISGLSSSTTHKDITSGNYTLSIDTNVQNPFWTTLKNGSYGMLLNGFVHIRIYNTQDDLKAKTFFINIS